MNLLDMLAWYIIAVGHSELILRCGCWLYFGGGAWVVRRSQWCVA